MMPTLQYQVDPASTTKRLSQNLDSMPPLLSDALGLLFARYLHEG